MFAVLDSSQVVDSSWDARDSLCDVLHLESTCEVLDVTLEVLVSTREDCSQGSPRRGHLPQLTACRLRGIRRHLARSDRSGPRRKGIVARTAGACACARRISGPRASGSR